MNKKTYKQPSMKVVQLENTDLICMSPGAPSTFSIHEAIDNYDDHEHEIETSDIWGKQW